MSQPGRGGDAPKDPRQSTNGKHEAQPEQPRGKLGISQVEGSSVFELVHPRCVLQRKPDYDEGMEMWSQGDAEGARDALRYALEGCGDNLWVHVGLGKVALQGFRDPTLARAHYGYAFELVERALPRGFNGQISRKLPGNQPFYEAVEGLAACYEALNQPREAQQVRARGVALGGRPL